MKPRDWNPSFEEGKQAFLDGYRMTDHRYGECLSAKDFERGWKQESLRAK